MMLWEPQRGCGGSLQSTRSPQDVCWAGPQDSAHAVPSAWLTPFVALLQNRLGAPAAIPGSGATRLPPQVWGLCEAVFLVLRARPGTEETLGTCRLREWHLSPPEAHGEAPDNRHLHPSLATGLGEGRLPRTALLPWDTQPEGRDTEGSQYSPPAWPYC